MSKINLLDPNKFTDNNQQVNLQMPKYEDMHIFAELTAHGRERSVIYTSGILSKLEKSTYKFNEDNKTYNLLGSNASNEFTTNWNDSSADKSNLEGFGIESIKVSINPSFIPQVDIKFVDYRGRTFFNNDQSPYRMLFDFPPPIFKLTIKGYYGLGLTYLLHLVKYTTEFKSDNGFFYIDAHFVALTFAPLADIPFRYIIQFAMLDDQTADPTKSIKPKNTYELILKIKALYSGLPIQINNLTGTGQLNDIVNSNYSIQESFDFLNRIFETGMLNSNVILFELNNERKTIEPIQRISVYNTEYNLYNKNAAPASNYKNLCAGYTYDAVTFVDSSITKGGFEKILTDYRTRLFNVIKNANAFIGIDDIPITTIRIESPSINAGDYVYIDLTKVYINLRLKQENNIKDSKQINTNITTKINTLIYNDLGMLPTIYEVFKIILDDVDTFFKQLNDYSKKAENHHKKYVDNIINDPSFTDKSKDNKIYSFPLVIDTFKKTRIAPIDISNKLPEAFPELILVDKFIKTFPKAQKIADSFDERNRKDGKGNNIWIPITPKDSSLNLVGLMNPFFGVVLKKDLFRISINRYYAYKDIIFSDSLTPSVITAHAEGEATNLYNALLYSSDDVINSVKVSTSEWINVTDSFYTNYLQTELSDVYDVNTDIITLGNYNDKYYINKSDMSYTNGFFITEEKISTQQSNESNIPFYTTMQKYLGIFDTKYIKSINSNKIKFTTHNLIYIEDEGENMTRYIDRSASTSDDVDIALNQGNYGFQKKYVSFYENNKNIYDEFASAIYSNKNAYIGASSNYLQMLLIVSCFGRVTSPFNSLNSKINEFFTIPAVIETPRFVSRYVSVLAYATTNDGAEELTRINNFFLHGSGSTFYNQGMLILADLYDLKNTLSVNDKNYFIEKYAYVDFMKDFIKLNNEILVWYNNNLTYEQIITELKNSKIFKDVLFTKNYFLNFDDKTFKLDGGNSNNKTEIKSVTSIKTMYENTNGNTNGKKALDAYFTIFIKKLDDLITKKQNDDIEKNIAKKRIGGDIDIINQTYYSFKNINDKWLCDIEEKSVNTGGYPFNENGKKLIDSFAFVDRTMNPIGDTMINPEVLSQLMENPDASVLTVLSTLISLNHFLFFPLQNFMFDPNNDWQKTFFGIDNNTIMNSRPSFVCMYLGGSASYPTGLEQYGFFKEDGILNLDTELVDVDKSTDTIQIATNPDYPWGDVKGFKVKFGEQNQSIFNEIKIDSKEYPETNESIQILAKLAGDKSGVEPIPKAQNLYNLYENRAYKATVNGLGNAMIQPSQYFQLENIPMFNGAYMILSVEHNINNNRMTTSFTGTKILKYPVPRVTDAATIFGFGSGDSIPTSSGDIPDSNNNLKNQNIDFRCLPDTLYGTTIPPNLTKLVVDPLPTAFMIKSDSYTGNRTYDHSMHYGIDFPVKVGTDVIAVADGNIEVMTYNEGGFGFYITINHGSTDLNGNNYFEKGEILYSQYGHLNSLTEGKFIDPILGKERSYKGRIDKIIGDRVKAGDVIAKSGRSGNNVAHLHFELRQGEDLEHNAINPTNYFDQSTKLYQLTKNKINK